MAKAALPVVCGRIVAAGEKHGQNLQALSLSLPDAATQPAASEVNLRNKTVFHLSFEAQGRER